MKILACLCTLVALVPVYASELSTYGERFYIEVIGMPEFGLNSAFLTLNHFEMATIWRFNSSGWSYGGNPYYKRYLDVYSRKNAGAFAVHFKPNTTDYPVLGMLNFNGSLGLYQLEKKPQNMDGIAFTEDTYLTYTSPTLGPGYWAARAEISINNTDFSESYTDAMHIVWFPQNHTFKADFGIQPVKLRAVYARNDIPYVTVPMNTTKRRPDEA